MRVKEFKNKEIIKCKVATYSSEREEIIMKLENVGINKIRVEGNLWLHFNASLKQLLKLEESGLFTMDDIGELRINCQH